VNRAERQTRTTYTKWQTREENGEKRIEGYFATFDGYYECGQGMREKIDPHAFDGEINEDVRCLIDHVSHLVLGRTTAGTLALRIDAHGLWGSVLINEADQDAMNLYARVERGDVNQCSFGFDIVSESHEVGPDGTVTWTVEKVKLYEVSCCTFPAYKDTGISARAEQAEDLRRRAAEAWKTRQLERLHHKKGA
jgi:HK97 family phage prohead protease